MTIDETANVFSHAVKETARALKIADYDWKSPRELLEEIKATNEDYYYALRDFFDAYSGWNDFSNKLNAQGGVQTDDERRELMSKMEERDYQRRQLINKLISSSANPSP